MITDHFRKARITTPAPARIIPPEFRTPASLLALATLFLKLEQIERPNTTPKAAA